MALAFLGTTNSPGAPFPPPQSCLADPAACLSGAPPNAAYRNTTWSAYLVVTDDAGDSDPTFQAATLDGSADPFARGPCGPIRCGAIDDFLDVRIGPDGTPWAALVDGCLGACDSGAAPDGTTEGVVGWLRAP